MATINGTYSASSPYYTTDIVNKKFLDVMINRPIPPQSSDVYWTITKVYEYRPDMLAYDLYSDPKLWWVFAQRNPNRLKDPYFDFVTGLQIYVPKMDLLKRVLGL
jgi:hypothetical protein